MDAAAPAVMSKLAQRSIRISVALALTAVLILMRTGQASGHVGSENAPQYNCTPPNNCYGTTFWKTTSEYFGAYTDILIAHLRCDESVCTDPTDPTNSANEWFVDNEIWLIDEDSPKCSNVRINIYQMCWIEAGYMIDYSSPDEVFFMYQYLPGSGPHGAVLGSVGPVLPSTTPASSPTPGTPGGVIFGPAMVATATPTAPPTVSDDFGLRDHFMIIKDVRANPISYLVFIYDDKMSNLFEGQAQLLPSADSMTARRILIGQELHGTGGVVADQATFTRNIFAVQPLDSQNNASFIYNTQVDKGTETNNSPPMEQWIVDPATSGSDLEGGEFSTHCC